MPRKKSRNRGLAGSDRKNARSRYRPFRKRHIPADVQRGLFTLFLDDLQGQHISQVWASTPGSAASMMAPWSKDLLRRARWREDVKVEMLGWDTDQTAEELAAAIEVPIDEIDPGCFGFQLCHVWIAEHESDGKTSTVYVVETLPDDFGLADPPPW